MEGGNEGRVDAGETGAWWTGGREGGCGETRDEGGKGREGGREEKGTERRSREKTGFGRKERKQAGGRARLPKQRGAAPFLSLPACLPPTFLPHFDDDICRV